MSISTAIAREEYQVETFLQLVSVSGETRLRGGEGPAGGYFAMGLRGVSLEVV